MSAHDHSRAAGSTQSGGLSTKWVIVLFGFGIIAGVLLLTEHRAHVLGALIWLPLLLCPLMHMFMHGHGGHGRHDDEVGHRRAP